MREARLFRLAASAWFLTAAARALLVVLSLGKIADVPGESAGAFAIGIVIGLLVGWAHWAHPVPATALVGVAFGFYAVVGIVYIPLVGTPPWFILLSVTGLVAFGLSLACLVVSRRGRTAPPT